MKNSRDAFTLIELLVTISIIGMLVALMAPNAGKLIDKAQSMRCASNLKQLSTAVIAFGQDHDGRFPTIEAMPTNPVYDAQDSAGTLMAVLGPYGLTEAALKCPVDLKGHNYFKQEGSSYMWRPMADDELITAPKIYRPRRGTIVPPPSRLPLAADFQPVHAGHVNCVFADGHVRAF